MLCLSLANALPFSGLGAAMPALLFYAGASAATRSERCNGLFGGTPASVEFQPREGLFQRRESLRSVCNQIDVDGVLYAPLVRKRGVGGAV